MRRARSCGTGEPGRDPGPQAGQVGGRPRRMIDERREHRRHAIDDRAALAGDSRQRRSGVEPVRGQDQRRAIGDGGEGPHDSPEAVMQGHGEADPVGGSELQVPADRGRVLEHPAVGELGALGKPGRARRVQDGRDIVGLHATRDPIELRLVDARRPVEEAGPIASPPALSTVVPGSAMTVRRSSPLTRCAIRSRSAARGPGCGPANRTTAPDCATMNSISSSDRAGFAVTRIAPAYAAPSWINGHAAMLRPQTTTRSPGVTPQAIRPRATRRASARNSAYVRRSPEAAWTSASVAPWRRAARSRTAPMVA